MLNSSSSNQGSKLDTLLKQIRNLESQLEQQVAVTHEREQTIETKDVSIDKLEIEVR